MVLACHLLYGAALASKINHPLVLVLAFLGHYFLDLFPHQEYSVENINQRRWRKSFFDFLKIGIDLLAGVLLVFIFIEGNLLVYSSLFLAVLGDGLILINLIFPNKFLAIHDSFHQKIHFLKDKKISPLLRILTQILVGFFAFYFLA